MIPKIADEIDELVETITKEANKLIRENEHRMANGNTPEVEARDVVWADFEQEATVRLCHSGLGWKQEFERQTGLKEGVLAKTWNPKGHVPLGIFHLCSLLKPMKVKKGRKVEWTKAEEEALAHFHRMGLRGILLRQAMQDKFGSKHREYHKQGVVYGACLRLNLREETPKTPKTS